MPFMNGARDGAVAGQAMREAYERVRQNTYLVIRQNDTTVGLQATDLSFAKSLLEYLAQRMNERFFFSFNTEQIQTRTAFVKKMFDALRNNDLNKQRELLDDKNILQFKGFFSSRLYDMLIERRGAVKDRLLATKLESVLTRRQVATAA